MPAKKKTTKLPKATFSSVAVVVSDRKRSLEWYTKKLGLDVIVKMDHWIAVGRKRHDGVLHLCQTTDFDTTIPLEKGNTGINLHLPGKFEAACAVLEANGVPFVTPPQKAAWGWWATVADPDGNEITLTPAD